MENNLLNVNYHNVKAQSTDADVRRDAQKMGRCSVHHDVQVQKYSSIMRSVYGPIIRCPKCDQEATGASRMPTSSPTVNPSPYSPVFAGLPPSRAEPLPRLITDKEQAMVDAGCSVHLAYTLSDAGLSSLDLLWKADLQEVQNLPAAMNFNPVEKLEFNKVVVHRHPDWAPEKKEVTNEKLDEEVGEDAKQKRISESTQNFIDHGFADDIAKAIAEMGFKSAEDLWAYDLNSLKEIAADMDVPVSGKMAFKRLILKKHPSIKENSGSLNGTWLGKGKVNVAARNGMLSVLGGYWCSYQVTGTIDYPDAEIRASYTTPGHKSFFRKTKILSANKPGELVLQDLQLYETAETGGSDQITLRNLTWDREGDRIVLQFHAVGVNSWGFGYETNNQDNGETCVAKRVQMASVTE